MCDFERLAVVTIDVKLPVIAYCAIMQRVHHGQEWIALCPHGHSVRIKPEFVSLLMIALLLSNQLNVYDFVDPTPLILFIYSNSEFSGNRGNYLVLFR